MNGTWLQNLAHHVTGVSQQLTPPSLHILVPVSHPQTPLPLAPTRLVKGCHRASCDKHANTRTNTHTQTHTRKNTHTHKHTHTHNVKAQVKYVQTHKYQAYVLTQIN